MDPCPWVQGGRRRRRNIIITTMGTRVDGAAELGPRGKFRYIFTTKFTAYCRQIEHCY
jgi:hypothetical protein